MTTPADPPTTVVALLLLMARLGDIGSTLLATPKLLLEANPLAREGGWQFAIASIAVSLIAYADLSLGIIFLTVSLLVCYSNFGGVWSAYCWLHREALPVDGITVCPLMAACASDKLAADRS
jgi:hypothetical protein